ncbi:putative toxin-antitoxin system toxin component, PIN family [Leptothrix ochracea]|uniref:putative toxin-antitoxin system toxin component, PIN family n=1 Tax=Leptothrix ochracea TaxID=735331 RepID=UPI0034E2C396
MAEISRELILDTNVALAWLLFDDPEMRPIHHALQAQRWHWSATPIMREEFMHVLGYPTLSQHFDATHNTETLITAWDRWVRLLPHTPENPPHPRLRCTDPDDQCFIDLAITRQATLITRDKALLALARRAHRDHHTQVMTPAAWPQTCADALAAS